ncbi:hypothetical protein [Actinomadura sp. NTSP31]
MTETAGIADPVDAIETSSPVLDELMTTEDAVEGLTAFAQKRSPNWRNR